MLGDPKLATGNKGLHRETVKKDLQLHRETDSVPKKEIPNRERAGPFPQLNNDHRIPLIQTGKTEKKADEA